MCDIHQRKYCNVGIMFYTIVCHDVFPSGSPFDHPLTNGRQYFIYAHGQEQNNYHFRLRTGIDVVTASDRHFYKDDQLKYHGFTRNRGSTVVDLAKARE